MSPDISMHNPPPSPTTPDVDELLYEPKRAPGPGCAIYTGRIRITPEPTWRKLLRKLTTITEQAS